MSDQIGATSTTAGRTPSRRRWSWRLGTGALLGAALLAGSFSTGVHPAAAIPPPPQIPVVFCPDGEIVAKTNGPFTVFECRPDLGGDDGGDGPCMPPPNFCDPKP
jgi:hypothetical protein